MEPFRETVAVGSDLHLNRTQTKMPCYAMLQKAAYRLPLPCKGLITARDYANTISRCSVRTSAGKPAIMRTFMVFDQPSRWNARRRTSYSQWPLPCTSFPVHCSFHSYRLPLQGGRANHARIEEEQAGRLCPSCGSCQQTESQIISFRSTTTK